jgi:hypothetical protein
MSKEGLLDQATTNGVPVGAPTASPIFILGIAARSGTNYLHDLIRMHPDCDSASGILEEDNLLANAHLLIRYADNVSKWWKRKWGNSELECEKEELLQGIGQGLIAFLSTQLESRKRAAGRNATGESPLRLVTKTPSVKNLGLFSRLFPGEQLIVLVRDGRSVVESAVRTFDRPYGHAAMEWSRSARIIQHHRRNHPDRHFLLVRYEDLYKGVEKELRRIFQYLHLDADVYDYGAAVDLPVRGSSTLRGQPATRADSWVADGIHWHPVAKSADFNPLERWANWSRAKHERFNWIAGDSLDEFGYARKTYSGGRLMWCAWNAILDALHVDDIAWFDRRLRRRWKQVSSMEDFLGFLQIVRRTIVETVWEYTELGT